MRKPFSRIGGKEYLASTIIKLIPACVTYCEPFAGGASVFFKTSHEIEVLNDLDIGIYKTYEALKEGIKDFPRSMTYDEFQVLKTKEDGMSQLALSCYSYFGQKKHFKQKKGTTAINKKDFIPYQERLKDVILENLPFSVCIRKYDSLTTFFYLDPPYEGSKDYEDEVKPQDVYDILQGLQGKFILSYNDSVTIRELFKEYCIIEVLTNYSQNGTIENRKVKELLITNF